MRIKCTYLFFIVYVLALPILGAQNNDSLHNSIDSYVNTVMARYGVPGAALAIVEDGKLLYKNFYKIANIEFDVPVDSTVLFQLSSLTKIFASVAVFQLVEKQKISLEDNISAYLDNLPANWKTVKLKHLLSHTSGLPEIAVYDKLPEEIAESKVYLDSVQFVPGERSRYTNTNFWLLKRIIEKVSNQRFEDFVLKGQFMSSKKSVVYSGNYYDIVPHRATAYEPNDKGVFQLRKYEFPEYLYGAAGLNISLDEFILWNQNLDNNKLLNYETKSYMWTQYTLNNGEPSSFTYGWHIRKPNNRLSVGFSGGFNTGLRKFNEDNLTIILLTNGYKYLYNIERVIENIAGLIDEDLENNESQLYESLLEDFLAEENQTTLQSYYNLKENYPDIEFEIILNSIGYELITFNKMQKAIYVFNINIKEHPNSWNAFDSLGEAYELVGDNQNAIENYKKSVLLNPNNKHAKAKILLLQENK